MSLVLETGSIVAGANTFVTRTEYIIHALKYGITVPDVDATDVELISAAEFIGSHEPKLKGTLIDRDQPLSYPRSGLLILGFTWGVSEIPRQVKLCQMEVALQIRSGIDPYNPPTNPNLAIKRARVEGAVDVTYAVSDDVPQRLAQQSRVTALLNSLLNKTSTMTIPLERA